MMTNEFEMLMEEVVFEVANPVALAGLEKRVLVRVWAERMEERAAGQSLDLVLAPAAAARILRFDTTERVGAGWSLRSSVFAVMAHVAAVLLIALLVRSGVKLTAPVKMAMVELPMTPPPAPPKANAMGGGGGQKGPTSVTKGTPPKFADTQIVPPNRPPLIEPKIRIEPTIEVQQDVKMASSLPQIGVANSPLVGMSMGNGSGTGLGSGNGSGLGLGSGGNTGGGPRRIGGGVSAPVVIFEVEPGFSEEARKAKVAGNVLVNLWVDEKGNPSHVHVIRGVGMGLDEKAVEAVKQYRFRPAMENGKPVLVELNIEVDFRIF
jgi:protein TonB